ncbi:MAG: LPP20 family lipoprotein [Colwellia sp.]|nr:LPP20 family lipoprotein [Colwellia sp.]MCW8863881.1 LPP20 family lipoprotein [Colwellia sp.]MCW9081163.1 LPP20 family lipoprotein [Colwellia sp.]
MLSKNMMLVSQIKSIYIKTLFIVISLVTISACSSVYDKHVQWQAVEPETFPIIRGIGYAPISLQKSEHDTQRMLMAIKASKIAAYAELAEQVYGQQVSSKTTMADMIIDNQQLAASVQGLIRGAKVVKSYPVGDTYTTELQLDFKDVYEIYQASVNRKEIKDVQYF